MLHDRFDLQKFSALFPLDVLRREAKEFVLARWEQRPVDYPNQEAIEKHIRLLQPSGEIITGPFHMTVVELLRAEALNGADEPEKTPTDVFIFARGEPSDRRCTKVGGLPCWPKKAGWPLDDQGHPKQFIAQFNFADSRFLFDDLPGDLLLIFAHSEDRSFESLECHWVKSESAVPINPADAPRFDAPLLPVYGVLHRTHDFMGAETRFSRYRRSDLLLRIQGTKIGGIPEWIQGEEPLPGRFLCALGSIQPEPNSPYPFVNVEGPFEYKDVHNKGLLMWGDVGSVYFFLGEDGEVRWAGQCY